MSNKNKKESGFETSYAKEEFKNTPLKPLTSRTDPYHIEGKDPNRAYKHISFKKFVANGYRSFDGWIPLTKQTKTTEVIPDVKAYGLNVPEDGFVHYRDLIVAFMPQEEFQARLAEKARRVQVKTESIGKEFKRTARSGNINISETKY